MKQLGDCRLYGFVDTAYLGDRQPAEVARMLCDGGADILQLRAKTSTAGEVRRMAEAILPVTRSAGVPLVINDYLEVAQELGAEICHLGQEDFFDGGFTHVSQLPRSSHQPAIGLSTHAPEQAQRALAAGADYVAIGPIYPTGTKPQARPVTLEYVRWAAREIKTVPWFAIGGITLGNLDAVLEAGATRICVVSAILNSTDIAGACRAFRARLV